MYIKVRSEAKPGYTTSGKTVRLRNRPDAIEVIRVVTDEGRTWHLKIALSDVVHHGDGSRGGNAISMAHDISIEISPAEIDDILKVLMRERLLGVAPTVRGAAKGRANAV